MLLINLIITLTWIVGCYNMKISGTNTQLVTIDISQEELLSVATENMTNENCYKLLKEKLYKVMKLPYYSYISGECWVEEVEYYSSHSYSSTDVIREVTSEDRKLLKILEDLEEVLVDKK